MVYKEGKADMTTARERYEAKTKVVTFRVSQELYQELEEIREKAGLSFADLIKLGAGITREEIKKKLSEASELQARLAELRKTVRQEQKTLDAFIDTTKKERLAKLEQQYQIYTLFDAGFSNQEVRFKLGIGKDEASRHFKEWAKLRGERGKLEAELLKKCLRNYINSLREYIRYRAMGRDLEEAKLRLEYSRHMLIDPSKLSEEEKALLIEEYSYLL
jgi:hypothetical protein